MQLVVYPRVYFEGMTKTGITLISFATGLVLIGGAVTVVAVNSSSPPVASTPSAVAEELPSLEPVSPVEAAPVDPTEASLLFMIEEEKLAHDVYVTLGDLWGSQVFSNIAQSEATHQESLLPVLETRAIADPRSAEVGVFVNADLQALYDQLIAQGSLSQADAIQVGIAIETKDINDIAAAIAVEDDADVISVYERLLSGSENHLAAFQRQA